MTAPNAFPLKESILSRTPAGSTMTAPNGYPAKPLQATRSSIDFHLRRVGQYLTTGQVGPKGGNVEARCVGAIALVYLDNAVMAPRDMSAAAAEELREGIRAVLSHTY